MLTASSQAICLAIEQRRLLRFEYDDRSRTVQPYCHGWNDRGEERLRAIQIAGTGSQLRSGKLWIVAKMQNVRVADETFVPDDPHYNPNDSALARIHCRV